MFKTNYLSNCDIINKYLLTDTYSIPQIKYVKLNISLKNLADFIDSNDFFEKKDLNLKFRTFIVFFLLNSNIPFLKSININTFSKQSEISLEDYFFSIIYSNKKSLNNFLFSLFIENDIKLKKLSILDNTQFFLNKKTNSKISTKISLTNLYDILYLTNSNILSANFKEMYVDIDFVIKNKFCKNTKNIIKSLPFFWLN